MEELLFIATLLAQALRITVPFVLAALGGTLSERSGVINIALEGKLLIGAFCAAVGAYYSGSVVFGALCGVLGGLAVGALYAVVVIHFRADQIVSGVAINLLAAGLTAYLLKLLFNSSSNSPPCPGLARIALAEPFFWVACALVLGVHMLVWHTPYGLRLRAVGDHPEAAATVGVNVRRVRYGAVLSAGALAGLGGAWLSLAGNGFVDEMVNGRGYIALAAVIMGKWRPAYATLSCLLFGFAEAVRVNLPSSAQSVVPQEFVSILPHLVTMIALAGFIGRSRPPAAVGKPY